MSIDINGTYNQLLNAYMNEQQQNIANQQLQAMQQYSGLIGYSQGLSGGLNQQQPRQQAYKAPPPPKLQFNTHDDSFYDYNTDSVKQITKPKTNLQWLDTRVNEMRVKV